MLERVIRMMFAAELVPIVTAGSTQCIGVLKPDGGNHRSHTANTITNIIPCQKLGKDTPTSESAVATLSKMEYCLVAEMIPQTMPMIQASRMLTPASLKVVGKRVRISSVTDSFVV
ncbi:hypothetical protein SDC9_192391 [bioreactor metagenome]|uniref:Uncharacterized protein n=1 Tax=bioreactor metagenome TaxID=1076179 RepID=A0A645I933_9ZZZZ